MVRHANALTHSCEQGKGEFNGMTKPLCLVLNDSSPRPSWTSFTKHRHIHFVNFHSNFHQEHDLTGPSSIRTMSSFVSVLSPQQFLICVRSMKTKLSQGFEDIEGISIRVPHSPESFSAEKHQTPPLTLQEYFWGATFFSLFHWPQCFYIYRHVVWLFYLYGRMHIYEPF